MLDEVSGYAASTAGNDYTADEDDGEGEEIPFGWRLASASTWCDMRVGGRIRARWKVDRLGGEWLVLVAFILMMLVVLVV